MEAPSTIEPRTDTTVGVDASTTVVSTEGQRGHSPLIDTANPVFRQGIALYDYQIEALNSIIEAEHQYKFQGIRGHIPLTEPFGSGKTFVILALIMKSPMPPMVPSFLYAQIMKQPYAAIAPTMRNQIIRPSAIVVARSVYAQWVHNLSTYTSLRFYEARDKPAVVKMTTMVMNGDINDYDVVLIKYGQTNVGDGTKCELCKLINQRTVPLIWSRVVYDDVDLIAESMGMRAVSSIFVTGATDFKYHLRPTLKRQRTHDLSIVTQFEQGNIMIDLPRVRHIFAASREQPFGAIWATLGHTPESIARDHGVYAIRWLDCSIINTEIHRATNLMSGIEAVDCTELLTMINGDAMISAARMLGISAITPRAMFASVLGTQRADYETTRARMTVLERLRATPYEVRHIDASLFAGARGADYVAHQGRITEERERILERIGVAGELRTCAEKSTRPAGHSAPGDGSLAFRAIDLMSMTDEELDVIAKAVGDYIQRLERSFVRIRENMADQMCSVCYGPLATEHVAIMRCCGYILCASCCSRGSRFDKSRDGRVVGICVQCRQPLDIARDVIFVESGVNVSDLIERALQVKPLGASDDSEAATSEKARKGGHRAVAAAVIGTKTEYIVALIRGEISEETPASDTLVIHQTDMPEHSRRHEWHAGCSRNGADVSRLRVVR